MYFQITTAAVVLVMVLSIDCLLVYRFGMEIAFYLFRINYGIGRLHRNEDF